MSFFGPYLPPSPTLWLTAASVLLGLILYLNSLLITEVEVLGFSPTLNSRYPWCPRGPGCLSLLRLPVCTMTGEG